MSVWQYLAPSVGSVISSALTNHSNVQLAREQREYDARMIAQQNAYNSPARQKQRLREAGINPSFAMQSGMMSAGSQDSSAGGQTAPTVDFSPIAQGIRDSVDLFQQKRLQDAQIGKMKEESYNLSIRNRYENTRQILELDKMLSEKNLSDSQREYYSQERNRLIKENSWIDQKNSSEVARNEAETFKAQEESRHQRLMNEYQSLVNEFTPKEQAKILKNLDASYKQIISAAAANNSAAAASAASAALIAAQEKGVNIDNNQKKQLVSHIVAKAKEEASMIRDEREQKWLQLYYQFEGKTGQYFPMPAGQYKAAQGLDKVQKEHKFYK